MDFVTRQFIVLAKKLRKDLRGVLESVGVDLHHIRDSIHSIDKKTRPKEPPDAPQRELIAVLHTPDSVETQRRGESNGIRRRDRARLLVEWLTLFAVSFYGYMAVRQWREQISARHKTELAVEAADRSAKAAEDANAATKAQFRMDQRPYLWVTPRGGNESPRSPGQGIVVLINDDGIFFAVAVDVRNAGKSPAIIMRNTHSEYIIGAAKQALQEARTYKPKYRSDIEESILTNAPNATSTPVSVVRRLTKEEKDHIVDGSWAAYIVGGVQYRDIFNPRIEPYETTYCYHLNPTGMAFGDCSLGQGYFGSSMK